MARVSEAEAGRVTTAKGTEGRAQINETMDETVGALSRAVADAMTALPPGADAEAESKALFDLSVRTKKLASAWSRPACVGFFGPSQAGKSFLVGALLSHVQGSV